VPTSAREMAAIRAVLDTNVVVSALVWGGNPFGLFRAAEEGRLLLFSSAALLTELHGVLTRPHLANRLAERRVSVADAVDRYATMTIQVRADVVRRVVRDDPDDDHVIAAAVAARVNVVVTGDRHLLDVGSFDGVRIVRPLEALALLSRHHAQ